MPTHANHLHTCYVSHLMERIPSIAVARRAFQLLFLTGRNEHSKADWSAATATGHGLKLARCPTVTSGNLSRGSAARRLPKGYEEERDLQCQIVSKFLGSFVRLNS